MYRKDGDEMTFEDLLQEIRNIAGEAFPNTAVMELPHVISTGIQDEVLSSGMSIEELAQIFLDAIWLIDNGSVEKVETLIERMLLQSAG